MFKNKIFIYFFYEFIKIFLITSLSLSILIWMTQAARLLELITEFGNSFSVYASFLVLSYPKIFNNIFLLSYAISLFFLFAKFESSGEISIYWLSGINKKKLVDFILIISFIFIFLYLFVSIFFAPWSSSKGRLILGNSKFTLINSLVKEGNFNSPLQGLTVFVNKNDKEGNLEGVFIYENARTIIASNGKVFTSNNGSYLELYNGVTHEKINEKINIINFKKTIFDFSKYKLQNIYTPKFNERSIFWLLEKRKDPNAFKVNEIREEINKRTFKPFIILIISIISCYLLCDREKYNSKKTKITVYISTVGFIILNQALIGMSGESNNHTILYIFLILIIFLVLNFVLKKIINT